MPLELEFYRDRLKANAETIVSLVLGAGEEQARWKPAPDKWSILEVVNHLYDEERFDFRERIDYTLHRPGEPWPPFDPLDWVAAHRYGERDPVASLEDFLGERKRSVAWLDCLKTPDWDKSYAHPKLGDFRAGDLLAAWLAHDFLHVRQLAQLHVDYIARLAQPFDIRYARP